MNVSRKILIMATVMALMIWDNDDDNDIATWRFCSMDKRKQLQRVLKVGIVPVSDCIINVSDNAEPCPGV
jgi:hypothetical protein